MEIEIVNVDSSLEKNEGNIVMSPSDYSDFKFRPKFFKPN